MDFIVWCSLRNPNVDSGNLLRSLWLMQKWWRSSISVVEAFVVWCSYCHSHLSGISSDLVGCPLESAQCRRSFSRQTCNRFCFRSFVTKLLVYFSGKWVWILIVLVRTIKIQRDDLKEKIAWTKKVVSGIQVEKPSTSFLWVNFIKLYDVNLNRSFYFFLDY